MEWEGDADKLESDFAAGPWNKLQYNNKPYALPIGSGPEMCFYNKAVFDKVGVDGESIKTWDDYYQAAAYKFVEYMTHGDGAQTMADTGTFPALKKILTSDSFTDPTAETNKKTNDYFGGQNVNEILAEAARRPA